MYPSPADRRYGSFVERCVRGLREAGIEVDTAVMTQQRGLAAKLAAYARFAWSANRQLLAGGHDGVWVHYPLHSLLAALPALALRRAPLALSFHGHDLLPTTRRGHWLRRLLRRRFERAERVLVPSQRFKRIFDAEFGSAGTPGAAVFASGGVDARYFDAAPPLAERPRGVLFLSSWIAGKGWPAFVALAARLAAADDGLTFTVAGGGPDEARIRAAVAAAGLPTRLRIVASQDVDTNAALYRSHRYLVLPTELDESLALVNLEAMVCGCIVLSRDFGAAREYMVPGENGFLFGAADFVEACTSEILRLESELGRAQALADAARTTAEAYAEPRVLAALPALLGLERSA